MAIGALANINSLTLQLALLTKVTRLTLEWLQEPATMRRNSYLALPLAALLTDT